MRSMPGMIPGIKDELDCNAGFLGQSYSMENCEFINGSEFLLLNPMLTQTESSRQKGESGACAQEYK